jgi:CO/xanthine dehydrogenase FAD-binding subunit
LAAQELDPPGNVHAGKDYQRHLARVLTRRALLTALQRCRASFERTIEDEHRGD